MGYNPLIAMVYKVLNPLGLESFQFPLMPGRLPSFAASFFQLEKALRLFIWKMVRKDSICYDVTNYILSLRMKNDYITAKLD